MSDFLWVAWAALVFVVGPVALVVALVARVYMAARDRT